MATVATFSIEFTRFLDAEGKPTGDLPAFAADPDHLIRLYRAMALARAFDAKAVALQRTGRLGTFASALGQEAVAVGLADPMAPEDVLAPSFREHGAQLVRGVSLTELFLFWGGDERGNDFAGPRQDFPVSVPVASQLPHAAGAALAFQLQKEPRVVVTVLGDGGTSKGDFYEALNFAGVRRLPLVVVVVNNGWAISVPRAAQTAAETLAQKAISAGIDGRQVDGNDVIAVRDAVAAALARARDGGGPRLIEALTYRLSDHTTADDASRYRDDAEVSRHWRDDPLVRLRAYLVGLGAWGRDQEEAMLAEHAAEIDAAAEAYLATPPEPPEAMFDHLYARLPEPLAEQRAALLSETASDERSQPRRSA